MNVAPFIIDLGTNFIKAELSGSHSPVSYRTEVGFEKYSRLETAAATTITASPPPLPGIKQQNQKILLGRDLDALRPVASISRPIESGNVINKSHVESLLRHIVFDCAKVAPSEHAFLLTEAVATCDAQRKHLAEFLFEEVRCSSLMLGVQPVLSLHATGRTSGIAVECGAGVTQTAAVFDGYVMRGACSRIDFGGNDISLLLRNRLMTENKSFFDENFSADQNGEWECIQEIKHRLCRIQLAAPETQTSTASSSPSITSTTTKFILPDGTELSVNPTIVHEQIGQNTFFPTPSSWPSSRNNNDETSIFSAAYHNSPSRTCSSSPSSTGLAEFVVRETLKKCDVAVRAKMCESVHLAGGATLMKNFPERFASDFANLIPASSVVKVHASHGRENAAWMGGNVVCQLSSSVLNFGVTRSQYFEEGEAALLKKKMIG